MIRVVLDTNIIVSALLQPLGPPAQVFFLAINGSIQLCISGNVYAEYEEVIRRPRLRRDESVITSTLLTIREKAVWVRPTESIRICTDPDDDIFLECAQAARATYLVTGNIKDFPDSWLDTRIVTARFLLEIMSGETVEPPA
ncbi:MAG TPA: putative toxin-antitoxin system toxin component, PIN family [Bryobacteraceae bacterium]|nr:putative toxin-antitoxin system toxin component, PIN family [Bryobacteraceae bacterium]